jgi:hypothetical protein
MERHIIANTIMLLPNISINSNNNVNKKPINKKLILVYLIIYFNYYVNDSN